MIKPIFGALCLLTSATLGQTIQNPSFETPLATNPITPEAWRSNKNNAYGFGLDSTIARSGTRSLRIASVSHKTSGFQWFAQDCSLRLTKPTVIRLRAAVKADIAPQAQLACQTFAAQKMIGRRMSEPFLATREWTDTDLVLLLPQEANRVSVGASLQGPGKIWFDDVRLEANPYPDTEPSRLVKRYLDKVIRLVKKHSIFRDSIPWPQTQAQLAAFSRGMQTEQQAHALVGYLLDVMRNYGDNHSFFQSPKEVKAFYADQPDQEEPTPTGRYLGDGIGYLLVPRMSSASQKREVDFATTIQQYIRRIDTEHRVANWVVDLRQNRGGNVWPMIAGLRPLLGTHGRQEVTKVKEQYHLQETRIRVALLLDSQTASSGEFTALTFIGLPGVRTFGSHTGGFTTGNDGHKLPDGAELYVAQSIGKDRVGKTYPHGIDPDEEVKTSSTDSADLPLEAAKAWLVKKD